MALFWKTPKPSVLWLGVFAGATALAAGLGASSMTSPRRPWYLSLSKPAAQPPASAFRPVWTALYGLMALSGFRIFRAPRSSARRKALRLWWTQLALNAVWSPLFFGAHRPRAAFADLVGMSIAAAQYTNVARTIDKPAAWMMAPYLGWLGFASYLNGALIVRNPELASA